MAKAVDRGRYSDGSFVARNALDLLWGDTTQTASGCWVFGGYIEKSGYGKVTIDGVQRLAHRVAWEFANGSLVPPGMCVCHSCDVPACVNPEHLWLGSVRDNNMDRSSKGRTARLQGDAHPRRKVSDAQRVEIKNMRREGVKLRAIASKYSCSIALVSFICSN